MNAEVVFLEVGAHFFELAGKDSGKNERGAEW